MTFKKNNKSAQAIFEYLILTMVVTGSILYFATTPYFTTIKTSFDDAFARCLYEITNNTGDIHGT
jgi:hypothetical protein